MYRTLYFIRHGHYRIPDPKPDSPKDRRHVLTVMGIEDIIEVAHKIRREDKSIKHLFSSPYKRALESADLISKIFYLDVKVEENLKEEMLEFGNTQHLKEVYAHFSNTVNQALEEKDGNSIIVSHRMPISLFLSVGSGVSYEDIAADKKHTTLLKMGEGVKVNFNGGKFVDYSKL